MPRNFCAPAVSFSLGSGDPATYVAALLIVAVVCSALPLRRPTMPKNRGTIDANPAESTRALA